MIMIMIVISNDDDDEDGEEYVFVDDDEDDPYGAGDDVDERPPWLKRCFDSFLPEDGARSESIFIICDRTPS